MVQWLKTKNQKRVPLVVSSLEIGRCVISLASAQILSMGQQVVVEDVMLSLVVLVSLNQCNQGHGGMNSPAQAKKINISYINKRVDSTEAKHNTIAASPMASSISYLPER